MDFEPDDDDFRQALRLHSEAIECHSWFHAPPSDRTGDDAARLTARRNLVHRGWSEGQIRDYAMSPERGLPRKWPPKEAVRSSRPGGDWGSAPDPMQAIRNALRRLGRSVLEAPIPGPERQKELTSWLLRNLEAVGKGPKGADYAAVEAGAVDDEWAAGFTS